MAHTNKFVIARMKDDDGAVDSHSLHPRLREVLNQYYENKLISASMIFYFTCCTKVCAVKSC